MSGLTRVDRLLPPGPIAPAIVQTAQWARDPVAYMERARARFGPIWTSRLIGFPPLVHLSDPDAIAEVFKGDPEILRAGEANRVLEPVLGSDSLFVLDGARHLAQRRVLLPPFHGSKMDGHAKVFREVAEREIARWPRGRPFAFQARAQALSLDAIVETILGRGDPAEQRALRADLSALLDGMTNPILLLRWAQIDLGPLTAWRRLVRLKEAIDRRLYERIEAGDGSVIAMLRAARHEDGRPMSAKEIRDELVTLLVAGHDTVAGALAWAIYYLSEHRDALERAQREVDAASDDALPFVDAIAKESLRLRPVLPIVSRLLAREMRIGQVTIPAGARAAPNAYLAHREPSQWEQATRFMPERFLDAKPSPYAYLPFGGGVRRCIGMAFALIEMRVVLAAMLRRVSIERAPGSRVGAVRRGVTIVPSRGMPIVVRDR